MSIPSLLSPTGLSTAQNRRWVLPFIHTDPLWDMGVLFALLPLWWALGVEQFVWPLGLAWSAGKVLAEKKLRIVVEPALYWTLLFLLVHFISGFFVVEAARYVTFLRNFSTYFIPFFLLIITANSQLTWRRLRFVLTCLVAAMTIAGILGLLALFNLWNPLFTSPLGLALPEAIVSTDYGGRIATRSLGSSTWFANLIFVRVKSIFMYATHYASALAAMLPVVYLFFVQQKKLTGRVIVLAIAAVLALNLLATTGRIAIISLLAGAIYYLIFYSPARKILRLAAIIAALIAIFYLAATPNLAVDLYNDFVFARGAGSYNSRLNVYVHTVFGILERPFFGWGSERDIPGYPLPAGSHSYYLGILYKQGVFGLVAFMGILLAAWRGIRPLKAQEIRDLEARRVNQFLQVARWTLVAAILNSFTDVLDLDATTMMVLWLVLALAIGARRSLLVHHPISQASPTAKNISTAEV